MVKKQRKFRYNKNLKKDWKKLKVKRHPIITDDKLKSAWDTTKSIENNYADLGLSIDPNKTLLIPKTKTLFVPEVMNIEQAVELETQKLKEKKSAKKSSIVEKMEEEAQQPTKKVHNLNENDQLFCIYMLEKYGDNYEKMSRDYKNYDQLTPTQLKKRINLFKNMKNVYANYLNDKKAGMNFLDKLDEKY